MHELLKIIVFAIFFQVISFSIAFLCLVWLDGILPLRLRLNMLIAYFVLIVLYGNDIIDKLKI